MKFGHHSRRTIHLIEHKHRRTIYSTQPFRYECRKKRADSHKVIPHHCLFSVFSRCFSLFLSFILIHFGQMEKFHFLCVDLLIVACIFVSFSKWKIKRDLFVSSKACLLSLIQSAYASISVHAENSIYSEFKFSFGQKLYWFVWIWVIQASLTFILS